MLRSRGRNEAWISEFPLADPDTKDGWAPLQILPVKRAHVLGSELLVQQLRIVAVHQQDGFADRQLRPGAKSLRMSLTWRHGTDIDQTVGLRIAHLPGSESVTLGQSLEGKVGPASSGPKILIQVKAGPGWHSSICA